MHAVKIQEISVPRNFRRCSHKSVGSPSSRGAGESLAALRDCSMSTSMIRERREFHRAGAVVLS